MDGITNWKKEEISVRGNKWFLITYTLSYTIYFETKSKQGQTTRLLWIFYKTYILHNEKGTPGNNVKYTECVSSFRLMPPLYVAYTNWAWANTDYTLHTRTVYSPASTDTLLKYPYQLTLISEFVVYISYVQGIRVNDSLIWEKRVLYDCLSKKSACKVGGHLQMCQSRMTNIFSILS